MLLLCCFLSDMAEGLILPASFEKFTGAVHGPLPSHDIAQLLIQVPGPFRPWKGLLGLSPNPRDPLLTPQEPGIDFSGLDFSFDFFSPL
jgi:hypothetical protein